MSDQIDQLEKHKIEAKVNPLATFEVISYHLKEIEKLTDLIEWHLTQSDIFDYSEKFHEYCLENKELKPLYLKIAKTTNWI